MHDPYRDVIQRQYDLIGFMPATLMFIEYACSRAQTLSPEITPNDPHLAWAQFKADMIAALEG